MAAKPIGFGPDIIPQFFYFVLRLINGLHQSIFKPFALLQNQGLVEVFLVLEELVEGADGEFGLSGDLVHGDVVVALLREEIEGNLQHLLTLPQFISFPPGELLVFHSLTSGDVIIFQNMNTTS